jgi:hypothetical protein
VLNKYSIAGTDTNIKLPFISTTTIVAFANGECDFKLNRGRYSWSARLIELLVAEEGVKKRQSSSGLVHWNHVTCLEHLQEGEGALAFLSMGSLGQASRLAVIDPVMISLGIEVLLAGPGQLVSPCLVAHPVADEVDITGVDQHTNTALQHGHQFLT